MKHLRGAFGLDEAQVETFERLRELLLEWNKRINLTAITDRDDVERLHFVDSLAGLAALPSEPGLRIVDVGSGSGLPGLALRIARPDVRLTLLDATRKKTDYLRTVADELGLGDVEVLNARAEEAGQDVRWRESWDVALARALAPLPVLSELCVPLVRVGGRVIAWKSAGQDDELHVAGRGLSILGARRMKPISVEHPALPAGRQLIVLEKQRPTPHAYPRRPGVPKQQPLV